MSDPTETHSFFQGIASKQFALLFLLGLTCFIFLARFHTYEEPVEHDITTAAVIANEMRQGRQYYSEVWENKPPAVHISNLFAQYLFGYGRGSIYALNVGLSVITLLGVYLAASSSGMGRAAGLWAAIFWTLSSGDLDLQANQPNLEAFMNGPIIWAFALILRLRRSGNGTNTSYIPSSLVVGGLLALASFYKPQCAIYGFCFAVAHLAYAPDTNTRKQAVKELLIIAAVGVAAWMAFFVYFAQTGRFQILYTTMFVYPRYYSGNIFVNLLASLGRHLYPTPLRVIAPLIFLTLIGGIIAGLKGPRRPWALLIGYAVATQVTIGVSGRYYNHYYQLWLPLFAVGASWAMVSLTHVIREPLAAWLPEAIAVIALLFMLQSELWVYSMDPRQWSEREYGGVYAASEELANEINKFLAPNETLYVFGDEPGFYFLTKRRPAVGSFFIQDLAGGPLASELTTRAINDLERKPPDLVVIMNDAIGEKTSGPTPARLGPDHPLRVWVSRHYCPVAVNCNAVFSICARPGSELGRRQAYQDLVTELSIQSDEFRDDK
jgi:hypothetical protein